jgi:hypothetical protein
MAQSVATKAQRLHFHISMQRHLGPGRQRRSRRSKISFERQPNVPTVQILSRLANLTLHNTHTDHTSDLEGPVAATSNGTLQPGRT